MNQDTSTIRTKNLIIGYGKSRVLSDITLSAIPGSLVALLGANGTGKSTLLKTLAGLCKRLAGDLWLMEQNAQDIVPREKATMVSLVLTDRVFPGYMTVAELVALGRYPYTDWRGNLNKEDKAATEEALEMTGLQGIRNKDLHELSDGQLQKALIARALAQDSAIMLLDEPLIHLDIPSKWEIMALLKQMAHRKQKTIILATHELDLSLKMADLIWLINNEPKLVTGTPQDLIDSKIISETFNTDHYQFK